MKKLSEMFKKLWAKFKSFGKGIRIAIIVALVTILVAIISLIFYSSSSKYEILFSNLDPSDAQIVTSKLEESKVDMKISGDSILVNKNEVDKLRMELAPELSNGSKGYELMDNGSSFGMTDEEFKIKKLRMLQGELEKSIKSLGPVESARVHITPAKDSVFVKDKEPGKAAVILKIKAGSKVEEKQVESIVALIAGSTENLPKENIEVIDDKMNLLTKNLNNKDDETGVSSESIQNHHDMETSYESKLQKQIVDLLEPVIGKNKVNATVNVDLDFDSKKQTQTVIDPNKVIVSQETIKEYNNSNGGTTSQSPIDNNMSNTIEENTEGVNSGKDQQTTNYESGKTETITISAPGEVKRMTASVFIDGRLDGATQAEFEKAIGAAIGLNSERGDEVSLVGMDFDPAVKEETQAQIDEFNKQLAAEKRNKLILWGALALGVLAGIIVLIVFIRRKKADKEERLLDVVIDDPIVNKEPINFNPIDFEVKNEKAHMENEIKKYAKEKPDQVVDIIKSWLSENER
ncbi:flagellar basal-body MS-ring/collar protein FliF [Clostridium paraputrificum]|uniref:flagellar basal-body MS-ring/collar protein FliF n=1 Tax=Clostridium paraputrificum TaxID=29363 RepID=UPI003D34B87A